MKKNFTRQALPAVAMLMVASLSLVGTTYAWFSQNDKASVSEINVDITDAAGGIAVSKTIDGTYSTSFKVSNTFDTTNKKEMNPASTGGTVNAVAQGSTMTAPNNAGTATRTARSVDFFNGVVSSTDLSSLDSISAAHDYDVVSFDLFFENTNSTAQDIYFNFKDTADGDLLCAIFGTNKVGDIDLSTEALRIGIVVQGTTTSKTGSWTASSANMLIFEPNWNAHLTQTGVSSGLQDYYGLIAATEGSLGDNAVAIKGDSADSTYQKAITPLKVEDYNAYTAKTNKTKLFQLAASSYTWVTVYVWIEGQDIDCLNAIAGEDFSCKLEFITK